jgi:ribose-phosphate pyrophosphokinase
MAQVFEAVGVNRVLTLDVHSLAAFQNSFRIPVDNLTATRLFVEHLTGFFKYATSARITRNLRTVWDT